MSITLNIYKFEDFELDEEEEKLFLNKNEVLLTKTEYKILLLLIQRRGKAVSRNDFLDEIWGMNSTTGESSVSVHISRLRDKLCKEEREKFIKSENNRRGYKFVTHVETNKKKEQNSVVKVPDKLLPGNRSLPGIGGEQTRYSGNSKEGKSEYRSFGTRNTIAALFGIITTLIFFAIGMYFRVCKVDCFERTIFISLASVFYGALVGIGLLLECAYQFDKYGWNVARMIPSVFFVNVAAMFAGLTVAGSLLPGRVGSAFGIGLIFLIVGAVTSCGLASFVLPNLPVTAARFQTQTAFAAFCKNVFAWIQLVSATLNLVSEGQAAVASVEQCYFNDQAKGSTDDRLHTAYP